MKVCLQMLYRLLLVRVTCPPTSVTLIQPNRLCVYKEQNTPDMPQLNTKARVLSQASPRKIFGGQTGTGTGFLRVL
jgi:hypothetical protein